MDDQSLAWLCLALTPNIGPKTLQKILSENITPQMFYQLSKAQLNEMGLHKKSIDHVLAFPPHNPSKEVDDSLNWAQQQNHHLITLQSEFYPARLKHISTPPPLLMVKGDVSCLDLPQLAIVGSRYPTSSGQSQAYEFAHTLSQQGLVITSGLARGIDAHAHKGALQAQGKTIAVLGTGLNEIYPKQNQRLAEEVASQGAVISEFPLGMKGLPGHFPRRNRIVSGLSLGTLVIEATLKSGSLITARQALEQNREVFAIPGPITNPQKTGCHFLIRQGASLIEIPEQIIEELSFISEHSSPSVSQGEASEDRLNELEPEQYKLLKAVDYEGINVDDLVVRTQLAVTEISVMLMDLELTGLIQQEQGLYKRMR